MSEPEKSMIAEEKADEIDLSALLAGLWRRRVLIAAGTLLATFLAVVLSLILPKVYRSQGVLNLGSLAPGAYKKQVARFHDVERFLDLARWSWEHPDLTELDPELLELEKYVEPVRVQTAEELRLIPPTTRQEDSNNVIALRLSWEALTPEDAHGKVDFLARHVRDALLYERIYAYLVEGYNQTSKARLNLENNLIETHFTVERMKNQLGNLAGISRRYPEAARVDARQLVSIQDGGERYLPLVSQQVGLEIGLAAQNNKIMELERDLEINGYKSDFFASAYEKMGGQPAHGEPLLAMLKDCRASVFSAYDRDRETLTLVMNQVDKDILEFEAVLSEGKRFISGPTRPVYPVRPKRRLIVIAAFVLSGLLMLLLALFLANREQRFSVGTREPRS